MLKSASWRLALLIASLAALGWAEAPPSLPRTEWSLNGPWLFQTANAPSNEWKTVWVPSTFQSHEGTNFHGIGWYRKRLEPLDLPPGKRLILHLQAAATEAEVFFNGHRLGSHLGAWTPFRFDVTPWFQLAARGATNEIVVRLDEKVGHNTQGFLPVIEPHFGGLWQGVSILIVPETYLDDLQVRAMGDPQTDRIDLEIPLAGASPDTVNELTVRHRLRGDSDWTSTHLIAGAHDAGRVSLQRLGARLVAHVAVGGPKRWSPAVPALYELEIELPASGDIVRTRAAFREVEAFGPQLRLNGSPLNVRGLLNWGYYPPSLAPNVPEERFRHDLEFARSCGFNLMKFCLWVPPRRFLELADEMGMLTWMEYPTWHPQLTPPFLQQLQREFSEFFAYDRNHPSIILRSLTCETGESADLGVIRSLYDLAHQMIPGALVEDDSSWIAWNRIADFYDDHPYGNNHTWAPTLARLNEYVLAHGPKPLLLGEAMAADTWVPRPPLEPYSAEPRPYWFPLAFDDQARWLDHIRATVGPEGIGQLLPDSLRYGMLMRRFQAETFRRDVPYGGYVISVIRDINHASMGLLDYLDKPKWSEPDWAWQRDTMCLLQTDGDARSFEAGTHFKADLLLSHFAPEVLTDGSVSVRIESESSQVLQRFERKDLAQNPGTLARVLHLDFPLPEAPHPRPLLVRAVLDTRQGRFENSWPIWVVPPPAPTQPVALHASLDDALTRELFPSAKPWSERNTNQVVVATHFDEALAHALEQGARVLMLPDGKRHSFPLKAHWFLQGAPVVNESTFQQAVPRALWIELQHFDLAGDVVPEVKYLDQIDPILMLWDTHGWNRVKTHGLIFETRIGSGRLLVSAVRHGGSNNPVGKWLLPVFIDHLATGPEPKRALSEPVWTRLKESLGRERPGTTPRRSELDILSDR